ncbi:MAG TPA: ABC transporter ATP-binding protein [Thermoplasmataceae archaeon]|nr:ABC transporter ATP-binding protein [Thermoplasmataceae archaeon]
MIKIKDLTVSYKSRTGKVRALDSVNAEIGNGEIFGIVGESGSGKSTMAMTIMGLLPRNSLIEAGSIEVDGKEIIGLKPEEARKIRGKKISLVFQGAMNTLNPLMKIEDQVAEPLLIHREAKREEALRRARETLEIIGLDSYTWKKYPHELSGGMKQRAVIATAIVMNPGTIIADEPSTALDVITQVQIMNILRRLQREMDITVIFISHDFPLVSEMADRIMILYGGKVSEVGSNRKILEEPGHPYTRGLINSVPTMTPGRRLEAIPGEPVNIRDPPEGCRFRPRCTFAGEGCETYSYKPVEAGQGHLVYCVKYGEGKNAGSS